MVPGWYAANTSITWSPLSSWSHIYHSSRTKCPYLSSVGLTLPTYMVFGRSGSSKGYISSIPVSFKTPSMYSFTQPSSDHVPATWIDLLPWPLMSVLATHFFAPSLRLKWNTRWPRPISRDTPPNVTRLLCPPLENTEPIVEPSSVDCRNLRYMANE